MLEKYNPGWNIWLQLQNLAFNVKIVTFYNLCQKTKIACKKKYCTMRTEPPVNSKAFNSSKKIWVACNK